MKIDLIVSRHPAAVEFVAHTLDAAVVGVQEEELLAAEGGYIVRTPDVDHGYEVGEDVVISDCEGWGVGDHRFKSVCRCGRGCNGGFHSTLVGVEVVPKMYVRLSGVNSDDPDWEPGNEYSIPVLSSATADDVRGKIVAGNLPLHLACQAALVYAIEFSGPPPRGQEYTPADMRAARARLVDYVVIGPEHGYHNTASGYAGRCYEEFVV